jgi:cysteine dioxygenase
MSETTVAIGIDAFVEALVAIPGDDAFVESVSRLVEEAVIDPDSVEPYAHFLKNSYTRNLVHRNERFEVIALCWQPGQVSSIHNHRDQSCWVLMARGKLEAQNYVVHDRDEVNKTCRLEPSDIAQVSQGESISVDDDEPVHQVRNLAEWNERAISIHIYSAPIDSCEVYCPDKGVYGDVTLSYWSTYGELTHQQPRNPCDD